MSELSSDLCPACTEPTIPGKAFCANCGVPLKTDFLQIRAFIDEALESRLKDRQYVTVETSVDVVAKLTDWLKLFLYWVAIPVGVLAIVLGVLGFHSYSDFTKKVADAKGEVEKESQAALAKDSEVSAQLAGLKAGIQSAQGQLSGLQASSTQMGQQYARLQSDLGRYSQVDEKIGALERELNSVQGKVLDLGNRKVKASSFEGTGVDENGVPSPSYVMFGPLGCGPAVLDAAHSVALCAEKSSSSSLVFFSQRSSNGDVMPISSVSPVGFRDVSIAPKPVCTIGLRGTIYVEKGYGGNADRPYLCVRNGDGSFGWMRLQVAP